MKRKSILIPAAVLGIFTTSIVFMQACKEDIQAVSFEEIIETGGVIQEPVDEQEVLSSNTTTEEKDGITWECTVKTMSIKAGAGGSEGFPLFSPNSSVVYPGNMLQGNSLSLATPKIIAVKRAVLLTTMITPSS